MRKILLAIVTMGMLIGCHSVYLKPGTLDTSEIIYAQRGGYTMQRAIKRTMERRGYNVMVGRARASKDIDGENVDIDTIEIPTNAKYIVRVKERAERFAPVWCAFNGFWWWEFNVSIAEQKTDKEILSWVGHGCATGNLRKLETILDELEVKNANENDK